MNKNSSNSISGIKKYAIYARIALHVAFYYGLRIKKLQWSLKEYLRFLRQALQLLLIFRHNKIIKVFNGYKLHLYLPAYPSLAFFCAIESKLICKPPAPISVVFSITKACSYQCQHCYQRLDPTEELNEKTMLDVAKQIQELGVCMFDLEGGEPFLRYKRLLHLVKILDNRAEIWVNSTGFDANKDKILELKNNGLFGLMVSIHSPDSKIHDAFTGIPGSFNTACQIIKLCRELNLVVAINSVLSENEIIDNKLPDLMRLAKDLDCQYVQLIHPKPSGKWLGVKKDMQQDLAILNQIKKAHKYYNSAKTQHYPSLSAQVFEESEEVLGCTAGGIDRFYLSANGELQPCEFLNISFGNVAEEGFLNVYQKMRKAFPIPKCEWLCCCKAQEIFQTFNQHQLTQTPLPWNLTKELIHSWHKGKPTPLYHKLGIYK